MFARKPDGTELGSQELNLGLVGQNDPCCRLHHSPERGLRDGSEHAATAALR